MGHFQNYLGCHWPYRQCADALGYDKRGGSILANHPTRIGLGNHFVVVAADRINGVLIVLAVFGENIQGEQKFQFHR